MNKTNFIQIKIPGIPEYLNCAARLGFVTRNILTVWNAMRTLDDEFGNQTAVHQ
jgi:hypothetical protein